MALAFVDTRSTHVAPGAVVKGFSPPSLGSVGGSLAIDVNREKQLTEEEVKDKGGVEPPVSEPIPEEVPTK